MQKAKPKGRRRRKARRGGKQPEAPACKKAKPKGEEKESPAGAGNSQSRRRAKRRSRRRGESKSPAGAAGVQNYSTESDSTCSTGVKPVVTIVKH
ncbi:MAG: hypothetical protein ACLR23_19670 [Clostridia bacterium]